jgi:peptidoglycan/LPS O-acetylase OafA/YrhL
MPRSKRDGAVRKRLASLEVVRVPAILAVIAIHTTPFESAAAPIGRRVDFATLLNQSTRFAVPFFLVVSGFFWSRRVAEAGQAYPRAPFGFAIDPSFRNGHLVALAFFVTGAWLQLRGPAAAWLPVGGGMAVAGYGLHLLEVWLSHRL